MTWLIALVIYLLIFREKVYNIYISKPEYYYKPDAQFKKEQQAKLYDLFPELRYEILNDQYKSGAISKQAYDSAMEIITDSIEINL